MNKPIYSFSAGALFFLLLPILSYLRQTGLEATLAASRQAKPQYNVLFIAIDDLRPELGCYGVKAMQAPHIDQLAAEGLVFERAYCQQAVCSPSRTSLLTGLRPDGTKVYDLVTHFRATAPDVITLPQHFKNNGYHTASVGKIFHNNMDDEASWSEKPDTPKGKGKGWRGYLLPENVALSQANEGAAKGAGPATEASDSPDSLYEDTQIALKAVRMLRGLQAKNQPFFFAVGMAKPHLPFVAPKKYWDQYRRAQFVLPAHNGNAQNAPAYAMTNSAELRAYTDIPKQGSLSKEKAQELIHGYYAATSFMDAQLGMVLEELKRLGLDKNTIIVLWGDHGWKLGEYGQWCKHTNYEVDTRSPLIVRVPGMGARGKKTKALVEFVDIYPSLAQLTGLPLPVHLQGHSFVPLLDKPDRPWKKAAFSQYPRKDNLMGYAMRTDRYRFVSWQDVKDHHKVVATELYDHQADPQERVNLAGQPPYIKLAEECSKQVEAGKTVGLAPSL